MLKSLKNARRRVVESVLEGVGAAEKTQDDDFDNSAEKFKDMINDMNEAGAALHNYLVRQKELFVDACEMSMTISRIFQANVQRDDWPQTTCQLQYESEATLFQAKLQLINDLLRTSCALECSDAALKPLRETVTRLGPDIEARCKQRNENLKDYDSFRRRLKALEAKRENIEFNGKGNTPAAADNLAEIEKFKNKVQMGEEAYTTLNEEVKADIIAAKAEHDRIMDKLMITMIVSQAEFFRSAARQLDELTGGFPAEEVKQIQSNIRRIVAEGGVVNIDREKTKLEKGLDIATGKALPSEVFGGDKSAKGSETQARPLPPNPGVPPPPPPGQGVKAGATASSFSSSSAAAKGTALPVATLISAGNATSSSRSNNDSNNHINSTSTYNAKSKTNTQEGGGGGGESNPFGGEEGDEGNPFGDDEGAGAGAGAEGEAGGSLTVRALFDHEAEEADELPFSAGDRIEVLETGDGGWWKGRCKGREGLFPVNYVEV